MPSYKATAATAASAAVLTLLLREAAGRTLAQKQKHFGNQQVCNAQRQELQVAQQEKQRLENSIHTLTETIAQTKSQNATTVQQAVKELAAAKAEATAADEAIQRLTKQVAAAEEGLQQQLSASQKDKEQQLQKLQAQDQELSGLKQQLTLAETNRDQLGVAQEVLTQATKEKEEELRQFGQQLAFLQRQLEEAAASKSDVQQELTKALSNKEFSKQELAGLHLHLVEALTKGKKDLSDVQRQLADAESSGRANKELGIEELSKLQQELAETLRKGKGDLLTVQQQLSKSEGHVQALVVNKELRTKELAGLQQELAEVLMQVQKDMSDVQLQLTESERRAAALGLNKELGTKELARLQRELAETLRKGEQQLTASTTNKEEALKNLADVRQQLAASERKAAALGVNRELGLKDVARLQQDFADAQRNKATGLGHIANLQEQLATGRDTLADAQKQLKQNKEIGREQAASLQQQLAAAGESERRGTEELAGAQKQLAIAREDQTRQVEEVAKLQSQLTTAEELKKESLTRLEEHDKQLADMRQQLETAGQNKESMQMQKRELEAEAEELVLASRGADEQLASYTRDLRLILSAAETGDAIDAQLAQTLEEHARERERIRQELKEQPTNAQLNLNATLAEAMNTVRRLGGQERLFQSVLSDRSTKNTEVRKELDDAKAEIRALQEQTAFLQQALANTDVMNDGFSSTNSFRSEQPVEHLLEALIDLKDKDHAAYEDKLRLVRQGYQVSAQEEEFYRQLLIVKRQSAFVCVLVNMFQASTGRVLSRLDGLRVEADRVILGRTAYGFFHRASVWDGPLEIEEMGIQGTMLAPAAGKHTVLFTYGESGSGKTRAMTGLNRDGLMAITLRALQAQGCRVRQTDAYCIYGKINVVKLRKAPQAGTRRTLADVITHVKKPLTFTENVTPESIAELLESRPDVRETPLNPHSSRSHLFTTWDVVNTAGEHGFMTFADLAGCENPTTIALMNNINHLEPVKRQEYTQSLLHEVLSGQVDRKVQARRSHVLFSAMFENNTGPLQETLQEGFYINETLNQLADFLYHRKNHTFKRRKTLDVNKAWGEADFQHYEPASSFSTEQPEATGFLAELTRLDNLVSFPTSFVLLAVVNPTDPLRLQGVEDTLAFAKEMV